VTKINHRPEIGHQDQEMPDRDESQDQGNDVSRNVYQDSHLQGGKLESYELGQREGH
jgi:hypothetical protein